MEIIIILILFTFSGIFEAIMDKIQFHYNKSIFPKNSLFWNPELSWKNKYKDDLKTPKFFGSTTFFVIFTDAWHLLKYIMILAIAISVLLAFLFNVTLIMGCIIVFLCLVAFVIGFDIAYI